MVVKGIKYAASLVAAGILIMYPEKAAALAVTCVSTLWDLAVSIGRQIHIPSKHAAAIAPLGMLSLKPGLFSSPTPTSEQKENLS